MFIYEDVCCITLMIPVVNCSSEGSAVGRLVQIIHSYDISLP